MEDGSSHMGIDDYPKGEYFLKQYRIIYVYVVEYIKNFQIRSHLTACLFSLNIYLKSKKEIKSFCYYEFIVYMPCFYLFSYPIT